MAIGFKGALTDQPQIKAGFIGCGSHSFRNLYPCFQFAPVELRAVCDLDIQKAEAFAKQFGAKAAYGHYQDMLAKEDLDAVFLCLGYGVDDRPLYPKVAADVLTAGCHVWMEKPPAATRAELEALKGQAQQVGKQIAVGYKKMFMPANQKAKAIIQDEAFGRPDLAEIAYHQYVPTAEEFSAYLSGQSDSPVRGFLDHICHPASLMLFLLGSPTSLFYRRTSIGGGSAIFTFDSGAVCTLQFPRMSPLNLGMERTLVTSDQGHQVLVENNTTVTYKKVNRPGYGDVPDFYKATADDGAVVWSPEHSLGQLYNKAIFMQGYVGEITAFANAILQDTPLTKGHVDHALVLADIFDAFAKGPDQEILFGS